MKRLKTYEEHNIKPDNIFVSKDAHYTDEYYIITENDGEISLSNNKDFDKFDAILYPNRKVMKLVEVDKNAEIKKGDTAYSKSHDLVHYISNPLSGEIIGDDWKIISIYPTYENVPLMSIDKVKSFIKTL